MACETVFLRMTLEHCIEIIAAYCGWELATGRSPAWCKAASKKSRWKFQAHPYLGSSKMRISRCGSRPTGAEYFACEMARQDGFLKRMVSRISASQVCTATGPGRSGPSDRRA